MDAIQRTLESQLMKRLAPQKVLLLFGARRVGKTFLVNQIVRNFSGKTMSLNGEDADTVAMLEPMSIANYRHLF